MRRAPATLALTAAALVATACGSPSPDLFDVNRTGRDKNANVRLIVSDGGTVTCNGGEPKAIDAEKLLDARALARDLGAQAALSIELPPEKTSTLRYRVRVGSGTVAFSDTSRGRPPTFDKLAAFTTDVVENVCGLER